MTKLLKRFQSQNIKQVRAELARAHVIIALLALGIVMLLAQSTLAPVAFDPWLAGFCVALLILVTILSFSVAMTLRRIKK